MFTRKINELVSEDSVFAWVLHYFGVSFYKYSDLTLDEVCVEKGINKNLFVSQLELMASHEVQRDAFSSKVDEYPIELVIEYLKHIHHKFVKEKLPYLSQLVNALDERHFKDHPESKDLKFIFPTFVKEFIEHIYDEEDELFSYAFWMNKILKGSLKASTYEINQKITSNALQQHALEHHIHESGMEGIRLITNGYSFVPSDEVLIEVLYTELANFEVELIKHAKIENEVFFPKALYLENKLNNYMKTNLNLN